MLRLGKIRVLFTAASHARKPRMCLDGYETIVSGVNQKAVDSNLATLSNTEQTMSSIELAIFQWYEDTGSTGTTTVRA